MVREASLMNVCAVSAVTLKYMLIAAEQDLERSISLVPLIERERAIDVDLEKISDFEVVSVNVSVKEAVLDYARYF